MATNTTLNEAVEANRASIAILSELKPSNNLIEMISPINHVKQVQQAKSVAIDRGMEALYMQNRIIDAISLLKTKDCFVTDNKGVVVILESLLIGSETLFEKEENNE